MSCKKGASPSTSGGGDVDRGADRAHGRGLPPPCHGRRRRSSQAIRRLMSEELDRAPRSHARASWIPPAPEEAWPWSIASLAIHGSSGLGTRPRHDDLRRSAASSRWSDEPRSRTPGASSTERSTAASTSSTRRTSTRTGRSEEIVGEVIKGRRDEIVLATKARFAMGDGQNDAGLSRRYLLRACEASLRRLQTDYIDLYQVHERDGLTPMEETLDALDTLVHQGKVRYIGCSNHSAWHLMKALGISERARPAALRHPADLLLPARPRRRVRARPARDRPAARDPHLEPARRWPPLGQVPPRHSSHRRARARRRPGASRPSTTPDRMYDIIETLVEVAAARGVSPAQVALAYLLGRPAVTSVIMGVRNRGPAGRQSRLGRLDAGGKRAGPAR